MEDVRTCCELKKKKNNANTNKELNFIFLKIMMNKDNIVDCNSYRNSILDSNKNLVFWNDILYFLLIIFRNENLIKKDCRDEICWTRLG